jgi:hypothetical protein
MLKKASQVAMIGNLAFAACVVLRYVPFVHDQDLASLLIILGWIVGVWVNLAVNAFVIGLFVFRRPVVVPRWLLFSNAAFALIQIFYCFLI